MKAICPNCNHEFNAPRSQKGAGYALQWRTLPERNLAIVKYWLSLPQESYSKEEFRKLYRYVDEDGINARFSELYALGLVSREKVNHSVRYRLDRARAQAVVDDEGRL